MKKPKTMKPKGPFKYVKDSRDFCDNIDGSVYEAQFQIADDGCPGSEQFLRVTVTTHDEGEQEIKLAVVSNANPDKIRSLGTCHVEPHNLDNLGCLLYGAAHVVTKKTIQPL